MIMKRSLLLVLAVIFTLSAPVSAQLFLDQGFESFYFDFSGAGARAKAMGNAFLGVSNDVTGASWNPAGVYALDKPTLGISYSSNAPRGSTSSNIFIPGLEPLFKGSFDSELDHTGTFGNVSAINFVAPIRISGHQFVGSFNFFRNYDEYQNFDLNFSEPLSSFRLDDNGSLYLDTLTEFATFDTKLFGGLNTVSFSIGTRLYKNWSFGISTNIYTGVIERITNLHSLIDSVPVDFNFQEGTFEQRINSIDTNKFSGANFTIGAKYNGEKLSVGLIIRTPFSLKVIKGISQYSFETINGLTRFSDTTFVDDLLIKYEMPLMMGIGFGYQLSENTLLALDIEYRGYSSTQIKTRDSLEINPGGNNIEFFTDHDPEWKNILLFRLGAEHFFHKSFGNIPLRAGFGYEPLQVVGLDAEGNKASGRKITFSTGTGIHWEQIIFDFTYRYSNLNHDQSGFSGGAQVSPKYYNRNHQISFSFTGVF